MNIMSRTSQWRKSATRFLQHTDGNTMVEHAASMLCLLMLIFGSMELCSATYTYTVLADAANEGVHYAIFNSSDQTGAVNTVKAYAANTMHDVSNMSVSVNYPDGVSTPPSRVAVSVSYPYVPYLGLFMNNPPTMHAYAEGRMVH